MNTIAERIYDFLKNFPPFSLLSREELFTISKHVKVVYLKPVIEAPWLILDVEFQKLQHHDLSWVHRYLPANSTLQNILLRNSGNLHFSLPDKDCQKLDCVNNFRGKEEVLFFVL